MFLDNARVSISSSTTTGAWQMKTMLAPTSKPALMTHVHFKVLVQTSKIQYELLPSMDESPCQGLHDTLLINLAVAAQLKLQRATRFHVVPVWLNCCVRAALAKPYPWQNEPLANLQQWPCSC